MYVREIKSNGDIIISTKKSGAITGVVKPSFLVPYDQNTSAIATSKNDSFKSYLAMVTTNILNVRSGPGTKYKINTQVKKYEIYTIIEEKDGWGKLKSGAGWVSLEYMKEMK